MKIRELLEDVVSVEKDAIIKISGILDTIRNNVIDTGSTVPESLESLTKILNNQGVNVDAEMLKNLLDREPLNNIVAPPRGDKVYFIGQKGQQDPALKVTPQSDTLEKMAKKALNART